MFYFFLSTPSYLRITCVDLEMMVQQFKYVRGLNVEPWKSTISREAYPGPMVKTDEDIRGILVPLEVVHDLIFSSPEYIKDTFNTVWREQIGAHSSETVRLICNFTDTVGSCSMLPRSKNGVVDPELKVGSFQLVLLKVIILICA